MAGLLFFPLLLVAVVEIVVAAVGRWRPPSSRHVVAAVVVTGLVFASVKLTDTGEAAYEAALGIVQWPFGVVSSMLAGAPVGPPAPVELSRDPTDLLALAALWVPYRLGMRRAAGRPGCAGVAGLTDEA